MVGGMSPTLGRAGPPRFSISAWSRPVARDARPWLIGSLVAMVATGVPQFISLATKEYDSPYFRWKMLMLLIALIFTFTIRKRVAYAPEGRFGGGISKAVALVSLGLWTSVAINGRLIGFFS